MCLRENMRRACTREKFSCVSFFSLVREKPTFSRENISWFPKGKSATGVYNSQPCARPSTPSIHYLCQCPKLVDVVVDSQELSELAE